MMFIVICTTQVSHDVVREFCPFQSIPAGKNYYMYLVLATLFFLVLKMSPQIPSSKHANLYICGYESFFPVSSLFCSLH